MKEENSLVIFTKASLMLAEANTIQKAKELKDLVLTAADWAKRKGMGEEAVKMANSYAIQAEIRIGEMLKASELAKGGTPYKKSTGTHVVPVETPTLKQLGLTKKDSARAQKLADMNDEEKEEVITGTKTVNKAITEARKKLKIDELNDIKVVKTKKIEGVYDVIVIDPPWPMVKIEREVRPNQTVLDYPTMTLEEIEKIKLPTSKDCHVWLWTTHRFLPESFELLKKWGLKYVCCFVWHKSGGFQPIGLPQMNCEFCLYARKGTPIFSDTKAFNTCFEGKRGKHSEKPEEFYEVIRRVTAGRRLDMFNRREISGFDGWGNESK